MPRSSRADAERHRVQIEETAARLFREKGVDAVSVAEIMAGAGLTHGGFYKHFSSKDDLAASACALAFRGTKAARSKWVDTQTAQHTLKSFVDNYLSILHRDYPGFGCPIAALASDLTRNPTNEPLRHQYISGVKDILAEIVSLVDGPDEEKRSRAMAVLAMLVGAMTIARATKGNTLSDDVLKAVTSTLTAAGSAR